MSDVIEQWPADGCGRHYPHLRRERGSVHVYIHCETETIAVESAPPDVSPIKENINYTYSPSAVSPLEEEEPRPRNKSASVSFRFDPEPESESGIEHTRTYYSGEIEILEYYPPVGQEPRIVIQSFDDRIICDVIPATLKLFRSKLDVTWKILQHELDRGRLKWKLEVRRRHNEALMDTWLSKTLRERVTTAMIKTGMIFQSLSKEKPLPCDYYDCYPYLLRIPETIRSNDTAAE